MPLSAAMKLVIKAHEGETEKTVVLDVEKTDTVESVKSKLQDLEGILSR